MVPTIITVWENKGGSIRASFIFSLAKNSLLQKMYWEIPEYADYNFKAQKWDSFCLQAGAVPEVNYLPETSFIAS